MTFKSEFELFDTVYALYDSAIISFNVRKILFPTITKWNDDEYHEVKYGLLPSKNIELYKYSEEDEKEYVIRKESQLGKTIEELFAKIKKYEVLY